MAMNASALWKPLARAVSGELGIDALGDGRC